MKKLRKKSKGKIGTLKTKLWSVFARYIRLRDRTCVTCGGPAENAGHYIHNTERRSQYGGNELWYDERNINSQCIKCNAFQRGKLDKYAEYLEKKYGHGILQELRAKFNTYKKWTKEELEELYKKYKLLCG